MNGHGLFPTSALLVSHESTDSLLPRALYHNLENTPRLAALLDLVIHQTQKGEDTHSEKTPRP